MHQVDKEPTRFEVWIFKKIFMPIGCIFAAAALYMSFDFRSSCENCCLEKGYQSSKVLTVRIEGSKCFCYLTDDQKSQDAYKTRIQVYPKT